MANIVCLVGSVYGNSTSVAEECAELLRSNGHEAEVLQMPTLDEVLAHSDSVWLVCTSTTGQGELPDNIYPFYSELKERFPSLAQQRYGLIALGDSSYERFADAGKQLDELLQEMQAQRLGEPLFIDACETADPEGVALEWMRDWMTQL